MKNILIRKITIRKITTFENLQDYAFCGRSSRVVSPAARFLKRFRFCRMFGATSNSLHSLINSKFSSDLLFLKYFYAVYIVID